MIRIQKKQNRYASPARILAGLLLSLLILTACDLKDTALFGGGKPEQQIAAFKRLDPTLEYATGGYGFDTEDNLVLIGKEETTRWLRTEKRFERFGGALPTVDSGRIQPDHKGTLYLSTNSGTFFTLAKDSQNWVPFKPELPAFSPESGRRLSNSPISLYLGKAGRQVVVAQYLDETGDGYVLYERADDLSPFRERYAFSKGAEPIQFIRDLQRDLHLLSDGSILIQGNGGYYALTANASEPSRLLDCTTLVGSYCAPEFTVISRPESPNAYLVNAGFGPLRVFRMPASSTYPVIPEEVQTMPGAITKVNQARFEIDSQGRLWGSISESDALTVDYPPYLLDVTTLRRLEGDTWKDVKSFQTPSFTWAMSEHKTLYSFGRQMISGGFYTGWGIYSLSF